ncbi:sulfite exporter TauE/SafE family protein [Patescibacteria group bacterium]
MNLWIVFLTGLTTGGLSCLAMQGGLLAGVIANQKEQELDEVMSDSKKRKKLKKEKYLKKLQKNDFKLESFDQMDWMPVGMFLLAKLISHTILGFLLGALGSVIELSLTARLIFQVFTALFMAGTAANLLNLHPIFRYLAFQPPKFVQKMVRNTGKSKALFAPATLGFLTIFIPCGVTQAMEVLVINSGNPIQGALTMFAFVLGTSPLFALIGVATAKLSEGWHQKFTKIAAYALVLMSLYSINGVLQAADAPISAQKVVLMYNKLKQYEGGGGYAPTAKEVNGKQIINIDVAQRGYNPNYFKVKQGIPVELTLNSNGVYTCASAFTFRAFNIYTNLKPTDEKTFEFTPNKKGQFTFACSMGMYTGVMEVI